VGRPIRDRLWLGAGVVAGRALYEATAHKFLKKVVERQSRSTMFHLGEKVEHKVERRKGRLWALLPDWGILFHCSTFWGHF